MDRSATAAFLTELKKQKSQPFHLFELRADSGNIYATDAARDIVWNGHTYLALSHFLEFSGITETTELQVSQCTVALSGVDQTYISIVLGEDLLDRQLLIYKGFLSEDVWLDLPGVAGNYASTPDSTANSITGDLAGFLRLLLDDYTPAATQVFQSKWGAAGNRSWFFAINTVGRPLLLTSSDGTATAKTFTSGVSIPDQTAYVAFELDVDDGLGNAVCRFSTSTDGVPWTLLDTVTSAGTTSIFDSTAEVRVGSRSGAAAEAAGRFYSAKIYRGSLTGALAVDFDAARFAPGATTAVMQTGETWTVNTSGADPAKIVHDAHRVVVDPIAIFDGRIDRTAINDNPDDGRSVVTLDASSHFVDFERRPGRHTNHEEQQIYFPGDTLFKRVSEQNRQIIWGRATPGAGAAATPPRFEDDGGSDFSGSSGYGSD